MNVNKKNFSDWHRTLLIIGVTIFINISLNLLHDSFVKGVQENKVHTLELCIEDLKKMDMNLNTKLDIQIDKIHQLEVTLKELETINNYQKKMLEEIKEKIK